MSKASAFPLLCHKAGVNVNEVSDQLGYLHGSLYRYERGESELKTAVIKVIAN